MCGLAYLSFLEVLLSIRLLFLVGGRTTATAICIVLNLFVAAAVVVLVYVFLLLYTFV